MLNRVENDIKLTRDVLIGKYDAELNTIYYETNEYIKEILDNFDVEGKNVLTVLASGDQAFHFYLKGAKNVDVFDINILTIYYYYLRRWVIMYLKKSYPDWDFDSDFLRSLLGRISVKNDDEEAAYKYWSSFADTLDELGTFSKYLFNLRTLNKTDDEFDNEKLSKILENDRFNFYNIDISRRMIIPYKYDIIYTSNISDYVNYAGNFNSYRLNLKKHLKKGGVVISSNIACFTEPDGFDVLNKNFDYHDLDKIYQPHIRKYYSPGYYYTKRKLW